MCELDSESSPERRKEKRTAISRKQTPKSKQLIRPQCTLLEFANTEARTVCVASSFNDWQRWATPMIAVGNDRWFKELALPPGRYEYRLVVDDQWIDDPSAKEFVPNPHGGRNGMIVVPEASIG